MTTLNVHNVRIRDLRCPQRCCCHPESQMVAFRNRVEPGDDAPIFRRPPYLSYNSVHCGGCKGGRVSCCQNISLEPIQPFPIVNECQGACSVNVDLRRYLRRLYKTD